MGTPYPQRPGEPDCRDYLRTGRCKYGESCKYNHPPNVESGGGVKPLNPSEPLFPIRPTEPPCQYFLKHGTCKFGQSCKFNHPNGLHIGLASDGNSLSSGLAAVLVSTNSSNFSDKSRNRRVIDPLPGEVALLHDGATPQLIATSALQILPQRPTEPNCLYFLRNGRCKYGATCKFHHPLDVASGEKGRLQSQQLQSTICRTHYTRDRSVSMGSSSEVRTLSQTGSYTASPVTFSYGQSPRLQPITESLRHQQPTHILLPDGQIAVILDSQNIRENSHHKAYFTHGDTSSATSPTIERSPVVVSPMLTATSACSSNDTFAPSADMWSASQIHNVSAQLRGACQSQPNSMSTRRNGSHTHLKSLGDNDHGSGSCGSLSAYGSLDSTSHQQVDCIQTSQSQQHSKQPLLSTSHLPLPQHKSWTNDLDVGDQFYPKARGISCGHELIDGQRFEDQRMRAVSLGSSAEQSATYYWPSSGSLSMSSHPGRNDGSEIAREDLRNGPDYHSNRCFKTKSSSEHYIKNRTGCLATSSTHRPIASDRNAPTSPPLQSQQMRLNNGVSNYIGNGNPQEKSANDNDDDGLTMMTSALLTMMDRHDECKPGSGVIEISRVDSQSYVPPSAPCSVEEVSPHALPPSGTKSSPKTSASESDISRRLRPRSPSSDNYFVGGYDRTTSWSPTWGDPDFNGPRF